MHHAPWLTVLTFLPLAGAVVAMFLPGRLQTLHRLWALGVTVATFAFALVVLSRFRSGVAGFQLVDAEFNALVEDLVKSLDKFKVPSQEKGELLTVLGGMKPQIVGK